MKEDNHIDYNQLAAKYFSGNATDTEVQQLESWVLSSTENKKQFLALQRTWNLAKTKDYTGQINVDSEWKNIAGKLTETKGEQTKVVTLKPKRSYASLLRIAAAVALLVAAGLWFFNNSNNSNASLIVSSESNIKEQKLSDGTNVDLNKFSSIAYKNTSDGTRQVALRGDAFFDVARDENHPFVISANEIDVKVLGTSFYVDARDGQDEIQVIVASGKVSMEVGDKKVVLTKGEIGTYTKSNQQLAKKKNEDVNYMAWKTQKLIYVDEMLDKVIFDLNRTFHADIKLDPATLKNCRLTATYDKQSLESILLILEKTLNLKANINEERIILSGSPCE